VPMMQCFNGLLQSNGCQQTDADCRYVEKECLPRLNGFVRALAYPMQRMAAFLLRFLPLKCLEVTAASRNAVHSPLASPRSFKFIS
jgi:hypothetical protein